MTRHGPLHLLGAERPGYSGADRRGTLTRLAEPTAPRLATGVLPAVIAAPLAGAAALSLLDARSWTSVSVGAADAALVAFGAAGLGLLLRWRLVGEAAAALLGVGIALAGFLIVPAVPGGGRLPDYAASLQVTAVAALAVLVAAALRMPPVRAGLRPAVVAAWAGGVSLALAVPLTLLISHVWGDPTAMAAIRAAEALACIGVAVPVLRRGVRACHLLFVASGAGLLSVAAACGSLSAAWLLRGRVPLDLPSFFLAAGAGQLALLVAVDMRSALGDAVLRDIRGRRRWIAAEDEVDHLRRIARGRRHDVASMLSAVDGTLMLLGRPGSHLTPAMSASLVGAVRAQVQQLMALLASDASRSREYDLSRLLRDVAALHMASLPRLHLSVEPGLSFEGHPDRIALAVNNLLVNAATHAPGAAVTLSLYRRRADGEQAVEVGVADTGPGLADADLLRLCEPGWRGDAARGGAGSGLGLFQCRQLAEAEGGELVLRHTTPLVGPGGRGLTAVLRLPARPPADVSSLLRMPLALNGAIPDGELPGRCRHRDGEPAGATGA